ncbi:unnamed protein product [Somion occarium]|uniref:Fungal-type protein kinase domain-containing protein n=1 Tax=Somion occarium TaxID=3059160 RepID=A0ABP1DRM8_9APHY
MSIGPMPIDTFLQEYFPIDEKYPASRSSDHAFDKLPTNPTREQQMYQPFVDIMNRRRKLCGKLKFRDTGDKRDADVDTNMRPDIVSYWGDDPPMDLDWSLVEIIIEWKLLVSRDGYSDSFKEGKLFVENAGSQKAKATRGQLFSYAAIQMTHQHRLFVYLPHVLLEFFWRYARMHAVQRGYDPTVSLAEDAECRLFDSKIKEYLERAKRHNYRTYPGIEGMADGDYATCKIQVNDRNGGVSHWIVRKPLAQPELLTPCGRCTRGYIAIRAPGCDAENESSDVGNQAANTGDECELYWMKDSWRTAEYEQEADIYAELKDAEVPHIPVIHCAGDVLVDTTVQRTTNQLWLKKPEAEAWKRPTGPIRNLVHHRVVQELLYPLGCVQSARELVRATHDTLETLVEAYYKPKRLHRDVSKNNVMLTENPSDGKNPSGILNDWDHSRPLDATTPVFNHRTGTWQFMSVKLLEDPDKPHEIFDDLESVLWVLLFIAVHHFEHSGTFDMGVFDYFISHPGGFTGNATTGGQIKRSWLSGQSVRFECPALNKVIITVGDFHNHLLNLANLAKRDPDNKALEEKKTELKANLRQLLEDFDGQLNSASADWTKGDWVDDLYPPTTAEKLEKYLMECAQLTSCESGWPGAAGAPLEDDLLEDIPLEAEPNATEQVKQEHQTSAKAEKRERSGNGTGKSKEKGKEKAKAEGKGKGKMKPNTRSKNTISQASSSARGTKRYRDDVESEDEEEPSGRSHGQLIDIPEEEEGIAGPSRRRFVTKNRTKRAKRGS